MEIDEYRDDLDAALGGKGWVAKHVDESCVEIISDLVKVTIFYDKRDGIVNSFIEPLAVESSLEREYETRTMLMMLGFVDDDEKLKSHTPMDILHEIKLIGIVIKRVFARGEDKIRQAFYFSDGYGIGYTDGMNDSSRAQTQRP